MFEVFLYEYNKKNWFHQITGGWITVYIKFRFPHDIIKSSQSVKHTILIYVEPWGGQTMCTFPDKL